MFCEGVKYLFHSLNCKFKILICHIHDVGIMNNLQIIKWRHVDVMRLEFRSLMARRKKLLLSLSFCHHATGSARQMAVKWKQLLGWFVFLMIYTALLLQHLINSYIFLNCVFLDCFCCYSVSHCSNKPTIKMIDWSFLCQWANLQNQQGIKSFFPHCSFRILLV